ncbi:MAG: alpha-L-arabinofuranosidase, partial [Ferruginibacter sp.]
MLKPLNLLFILTFFASFYSCKKTTEPTPLPTPVIPPPVIVTPTDPAIANTIGFFLDDWKAKTFTVPTVTASSVPTAAASATVSINTADIITKIPQSIFGNNGNSWMTQMITEPALIAYLTNYHSHIIRFPGGSISDLYFWNKPANTPPADVPATLVDENGNISTPNYWFGKITDSWTISVDNYYNMLQQTGNQGMITVNYGYARYGTSANPVAAAAHLAADWVRYDNGRTKYWEVGNENFGSWEAGYRINTATNADGQPQLINGKTYGDHFKIFADSMHKAAQEIGKTIYVSAVIMEKAPESYIAANLQTWNADVMQHAGSAPDYYSVHSYFTPYNQNSDPATILNSPATEENTIMSYVKSSITNGGLTQKPVALTEYNIFAEGSAQEISNINGLHAVMVIGEGLKNKFGMAARWDLANAWNNGNDMGLFNIGDETGVPKWNARAPYYYMYYLQKTMGDRFVNSTVTGSVNIKSYASTYSTGQVAVTLINTSATALTVGCNFLNFIAGNNFYWYSLNGGTDNGNFSKNVFVNGVGSSVNSGGPANYNTLN